jgi:phosphopantothenoylcysteine synthetase/decarboxylase
MKKVLITSGGTREYIDDVRVLTNISSGKLGAMIAEKLFSNGYEVHYVHSIGSIEPRTNPERMDCVNKHSIKDVAGLVEKMEELAPQMDVVIHAMAVSDFGFDRSKPVKLKSNDPEGFIEYMRQTIKVNPKVLPMIKEWNPDTLLISFKFEVGLSLTNLFDVAIKSMIGGNSDFVVANDKEEMVNFGKHIAYILRNGSDNIFSEDGIYKPYHYTICYNKKEIAERIADIIRRCA